MAPRPSRGEIWSATLDPVCGHEQAGTRPVLVISTDTFNHGPAGLVLAIPLTRTNRRLPLHVPLEPPEGGVTARSFIMCDAVRSISQERLSAVAWGRVSPATLRQVEDALRVLLAL